jgi:hypothetical protein
LQVTQQEISDYCRTLEQKIASFLQPATKITDEEYGKLGHKDPDVYPLKFGCVNRIYRMCLHFISPVFLCICERDIKVPAV